METSMHNYSIRLPGWSIGDQVLSNVPDYVLPYGRRAAFIGGHHALAALSSRLRASCADRLDCSEDLWYGGEASEENVAMLAQKPEVIQSDVLFAIGGGKALDTVKTLGYRLGKPVFTFPTIASTCAACTAVSILYHPDGSFSGPCFLPGPPVHAFLDTGVLAAAPVRYLWAGLGDTYAKYFESEMSSRTDELTHYHALGVNVSRMCLEPLLRYGARAMEDLKAGRVSAEVEQVILSIIVNTAIASILLTADRIIDYNTGLAHAVFYALTSFPEFHMERDHLHGEVVGFAVLILLLVDHQDEMFQTMLDFNRSVRLPTRLSQIGICPEDLPRILPRVLQMHDIDHNPYTITESMLADAFCRLENTEK